MGKKRKSVRKQGAIELSMTTVIVIIIGVVLLSLGLVFVKNIFGKVDVLTNSAFGNADKELQNFQNVENELTLTRGAVSLKQGESDGLGIIVKNMGSKDAKFKVRTSIPVGNTGKSPKFTCNIQETQSSESSEFILSSGEKRSFHLLIIDEGKSAIGTYVCAVTMLKDGKEYPDSVRVQIE